VDSKTHAKAHFTQQHCKPILFVFHKTGQKSPMLNVKEKKKTPLILFSEKDWKNKIHVFNNKIGIIILKYFFITKNKILNDF
jgi:hypothetical protein